MIKILLFCTLVSILCLKILLFVIEAFILTGDLRYIAQVAESYIYNSNASTKSNHVKTDNSFFNGAVFGGYSACFAACLQMNKGKFISLINDIRDIKNTKCRSWAEYNNYIQQKYTSYFYDVSYHLKHKGINFIKIKATNQKITLVSSGNMMKVINNIGDFFATGAGNIVSDEFGNYRTSYSPLEMLIMLKVNDFAALGINNNKVQELHSVKSIHGKLSWIASVMDIVGINMVELDKALRATQQQMNDDNVILNNLLSNDFLSRSFIAENFADALSKPSHVSLGRQL